MMRASTILRRSTPIELEKDRATPVYGDLAEGISLEEVIAHDPKSLLDLRSIKFLAAVHRQSSLYHAAYLSRLAGVCGFVRAWVVGQFEFENHAHPVALFAFYYNFVRIHKTLRVTPTMAAGVTDHLWEIGDIVRVLEEWETAQ